MNPVDLILALLIAAILAGAVILTVRRRRKGSSCCGDCGKCQNSCDKPEKKC